MLKDFVLPDFELLGHDSSNQHYVLEITGEIFRWMKESYQSNIIFGSFHVMNMSRPYTVTVNEELYLLLLLRWA